MYDLLTRHSTSQGKRETGKGKREPTPVVADTRRHAKECHVENCVETWRLENGKFPVAGPCNGPWGLDGGQAKASIEDPGQNGGATLWGKAWTVLVPSRHSLATWNTSKILGRSQDSLNRKARNISAASSRRSDRLSSVGALEPWNRRRDGATGCYLWLPRPPSFLVSRRFSPSRHATSGIGRGS